MEVVAVSCGEMNFGVTTHTISHTIILGWCILWISFLNFVSHYVRNVHYKITPNIYVSYQRYHVTNLELSYIYCFNYVHLNCLFNKENYFHIDMHLGTVKKYVLYILAHFFDQPIFGRRPVFCSTNFQTLTNLLCEYCTIYL